MLAILRKRNKRGCPRVPTDLDRELRSHVEKAVNGMLDAKASGTYVRPTRIILDTEAISVARKDLDVVTGLMSVPGEEDRTVVHEEPVMCDVPSESTGWGCLAQTLDEDCIGYIEACLDGKGRMFAKNRGSSMSILEGRINDTAMDLVGDIIVEDGSVIEDYVDDVRDMLGM